MSDDTCLYVADEKSPVKLIRCHGMIGKLLLTYDL